MKKKPAAYVSVEVILTKNRLPKKDTDKFKTGLQWELMQYVKHRIAGLSYPEAAMQFFLGTFEKKLSK